MKFYVIKWELTCLDSILQLWTEFHNIKWKRTQFSPIPVIPVNPIP